MLRVINIIILCLLGLSSSAQTCSIISTDYVCKEELINFDVSSSAGISSLSWDMGDGSSFSQKTFNHKYATAGEKTVTVTINLTGGGTCIASKKIKVYNAATFKISKKPDNIYCLWENKICLLDSSFALDSGVTIKKRIILWDDGSQSVSNNPPKADEICHTYTNSGTFKVTIELTTDKDCKVKQEIEIKILKDIVPNIKVYTPDNKSARLCDSARTFFEDKTTADTSTLLGKIYDWGDGTKVTTRSKIVSHYYKNSGSYKVSLSYIQQNGCITKKDTTIQVTVYSVEFDISKNAYKQCSGNIFRIKQTDNLSGAYYYWSLNDTVVAWDQDMKFLDIGPSLGKKYISLLVDNYGCVQNFKYDSLEVIGFEPKIIILNNNQCQNLDTVYFIVRDKRYGMGKISYFMNFDDDQAPTCTTSRANGINVESNCNYTTDSIGKHFYVNGFCRKWEIKMKDEEHGCGTIVRNGSINVEMPTPEKVKFRYVANRKCIGDKVEYYIEFKNGICDLVDVKVNLDSACSKRIFSNRFIVSYPYKYTCNKDGWVTVGFAMKYGDPKIYKSFSDTSNYIIDPNRICLDTIWYHNWFRLLEDPVADYKIERLCLPAHMEPLLKDSIQKNLTFSFWDWGDGTPVDTIKYSSTDSIIPKPDHTYNKAGAYQIKHYVENEGRCYSLDTQNIVLGFKMKLAFDSVICPGDVIQLFDTIYYGDTSHLYWLEPDRKKAGKETYKWDLDDGRGFSNDTSNPMVKFPKTGFYKIRLAAKDSTNCLDTLTQVINVGGVHAGIRKIDKKIICDDIIQFLDSSYSDYKPPLDSIVKYYWEFGDGGNPSTLKNPYQFYKTYGEYTIFQRVENSRGCKDSTTIKIVIEGPVAGFEVVSDTIGCAPFRAEFKNNSIKAKDYIWYFGDPAQSKLSTNQDTNVSFIYKTPGVYYVYLFASDSVLNPNAGNALYYCKSNYPDTTLDKYTLIKITVLPGPKADFLVDSLQCAGRPIIVRDNSDSLYTLYRWKIKGGDTASTTNKNGILYSNDTGFVRIHYYPWYAPQGGLTCLDTTGKTIRVTAIYADFEITRDSSQCSRFVFNNKTKNFAKLQWDLDDEDSKDNYPTTESFEHDYSSDKSQFNPCLMVENANGCMDTICKDLDIQSLFKLIIPNVFTPNNDGLNDVFEILSEGIIGYDLSIYNRWGQLVFRSEKDGKGNDGYNWNGKKPDGVGTYPEGTYFYMFNYTYNCEKVSRLAEGTITLINPKE